MHPANAGLAGYRKSEKSLIPGNLPGIFFVHLHSARHKTRKQENRGFSKFFLGFQQKCQALSTENQKRRLKVPREPRIYIEKVLYLITCKGLDDHDLFIDQQDYADYLKFLSGYKREYGFKLFAYALLPKRLCLLIELKKWGNHINDYA